MGGPINYNNAQNPTNSTCDNDRLGAKIPFLVQLADGEVAANKSNTNGASSVLSDAAVGAQQHGKHT